VVIRVGSRRGTRPVSLLTNQQTQTPASLNLATSSSTLDTYNNNQSAVHTT
jgi:hypothetical protein